MSTGAKFLPLWFIPLFIKKEKKVKAIFNDLYGISLS